LTIFGLILGGLIGGIIVVENVFAWPGLGALLLSAIGEYDYNTVVGIVLCTATAYVATSLGVDLLYYVLDPRTRRA
jgi:peptide/nickel transport system permease protein